MSDKLVIKKLVNPWPDVKGYTFILPSVCVGNVGQLAMDLLISTLEFLHHPALLPIVGYDPYNNKSTEISTAADLHLCKDKKVVLLQIRSPLIKVEKESFLKELSSWVSDCAFRSAIVLSSSHAQLRFDAQMIGSQFRYICNEFQHPDIDRLREVGGIEMEEREDDCGVKKRRLPGGGFALKFLTLSKIPTVVLTKFVDEGDNTNDALSVESPKWKKPFSWKNLFGAPPPLALY
ncbi:Proteasome assembly chaperone 2 [Armadillidium nasatum]|uniref:Proteasome assembly chaperone 2 n=1 Tax=Armadillidium nasatum TaxID=96803 RepID=A0A5N5SPW4_9CRUS|nr:Proteasome assembly chaperone 2 [Armadillidium nasatum]